MRKLRKIGAVLWQTGPTQLACVAYIASVLPLIMRWHWWFAPHYQRFHKVLCLLRAGSSWRELLAQRDAIVRAGSGRLRLPLEDFLPAGEELEAVRAGMEAGGEVVLAEIDQDGYLLSHVGPIEDPRTITPDRFVARRRFSLFVVALDGCVGVKKDFRGDRFSFVTELRALHELGLAGCQVPAVIAVDFDRLTLTVTYIPGAELRLAMAELGATLLDRDIERQPGYHGLSAAERRQRQVVEGLPRLQEVVNRGYAERVYQQLITMHRAGYIWKDIKYGNMLVGRGDGEPYLIDFDTTYSYRKIGRNLFRILCDQNIEELNRCFGLEKPTWRRVRKALLADGASGDRYSPAYFGYGLKAGSLLKNWVGFGRWNFILSRSLPSLEGARLLDLGSNDAFHSLQALRHGAAEALAVERNPQAIERGMWFKQVFEWADNRDYNFRYIQADMTQIPDMELGHFDFVMALCSIYYLADGEIARLIRHISDVSDTMLLMCNTEENIGRPAAHEYRKASVEYAVASLQANGFPQTVVTAPPRYSRPLVVGRRLA
ncbi:MAG: methyltransferase domain-containing protein [Gemmatimonadetes bacterium]|nr:methyltransferase domain-containing protein [Gemmatimonadota bacterium]